MCTGPRHVMTSVVGVLLQYTYTGVPTFTMP